MEPMPPPTNQVPVWAQWIGIWSGVIGTVVLPCLLPLGRLIERKIPLLGFLVRLSSFVMLAILAILSLSTAFAFNGSSQHSVALAILGTLCSIAGVFCLLSLFPRFLPRLLLFTVKKLSPVGMCRMHKGKIRQTFDSFDLLMQRNTQSAWLLPPPSPDVVSDNEHGMDYLELEFREWSWLVTGIKGRNGLLEDTQYLFITWHWPHPPKDEDKNLVEKLGPMLKKVGEYTLKNGLVTHRVLVGPWLSMKTTEWAKFKDMIWTPYFADSCNLQNTNYRIRFIDLAEIWQEFDSPTDRSFLQRFMDVALFSFDPNMQTLVKNNENIILPFPEEYPAQKLQEYAALQYSERFDNFLALQAVQGTSAKGRGTKYGDRAIKERRLAVKKVWDKARNIKGINAEIKTTAAIDFCEL